MGIVGLVRGGRQLRGVVFVCGVLLMLCPVRANAGSISSPAVIAPLVHALSSEPFGSKVALLMDGGLRQKWLTLEEKIEQENRTLEACRDDRAHCSSPEALQFLAIIDSAASRDGLARLGEVNRAINLAIRPGSDLANYGVEDYWSPPLATLAKGSGDCEDYAIAKFVALRNAGVAADDLRLVIVRDVARAEDHAVVAARLEDHWVMLDNRRMIMPRDTDFAGYRPTFVISESGVGAVRPDTTTPGPAPVPASDMVVASIAFTMLGFDAAD